MKFLLLALVVVFAVASVADARKVLFARNAAPSDWAAHKPVTSQVHLDRSITFHVALKQRNLPSLEKKFWAVSDPTSHEYQNYMTVQEIQDLIAPEKADHDRVLDYFVFQGVDSVKSTRDSLEVTCSVSKAAEIFQTEFHTFTHEKSGRSIIRQWGEYSVVDGIADMVEIVAGLSEFPIARLSTRRPAPAMQAVGGGMIAVIPQTIQSMYGSPSHNSSFNVSGGVIEFEGQSYSPSDLQTFASDYQIPIPALTANHVIGPNSPSSPGDEAQLDIQFMAGVAIGQESWFWLEGGQAWLYGFATHFLNSGKAIPSVISISYGWNEAQQCTQGIGGAECSQLGIDSTQYVNRVNTEFQKIGLVGVSIMVASGDSGANGRSDGLCLSKKLNPSYPAASPYVTAVGATQVTNPSTSLSNPPPICNGQLACISGGTEECVSFSQAHFASGGGFSNIASTPSYQASAVKNFLSTSKQLPPSSYFNAAGRGFPDVAALGSAGAIVSGGNINLIGGTSMSSPIFAALIVRLNEISLRKNGKTLGFLNPLIYQMPADNFRDITIGDNHCTENGCGIDGSCKGFYATAGWDPVSGRGSLHYEKAAAYIQNM